MAETQTGRDITPEEIDRLEAAGFRRESFGRGDPDERWILHGEGLDGLRVMRVLERSSRDRRWSGSATLFLTFSASIDTAGRAVLLNAAA